MFITGLIVLILCHVHVNRLPGSSHRQAGGGNRVWALVAIEKTSPSNDRNINSFLAIGTHRVQLVEMASTPVECKYGPVLG